MQVVETPTSVPQNATDTTPVPQVPAQDKAANEDEFGSNSQLIRNITAFGDCV